MWPQTGFYETFSRSLHHMVQETHRKFHCGGDVCTTDVNVTWARGHRFTGCCSAVLFLCRTNNLALFPFLVCDNDN